MTTRRVLAVIGLLLGVCAAAFVVLFTRPIVSEEQLGDAREEVELVRGSMDAVTCERPPLFGTAISTALPLGEFLSETGPFAECWRAAGDEALVDVFVPLDEDDEEITDNPRADGEFGAGPLDIVSIRWQPSPFDSNVLPTPIAEVIRHCGELAAELERQARTPDRCTPVRPSTDAWQEQAREAGNVRAPLNLARATRVIARRMAIDDGDGALRLLVQGMATARDTGHGPSGFLQAMFAIAAEGLLAETFQSILSRHDPSVLARGELVAALDALESTPIDIHVLLAAEFVALYDATRASPPRGETEDERLFAEYTAATLLPRVMEACPPGTGLQSCVGHFPLPHPGPMHWLDSVLGPRAQAPTLLAINQSIGTESISTYLHRIEGAQGKMRLMKILLRWADERSRGRCPEVDEPWTLGRETLHVARNGAGEFRLLAPLGQEQIAFYFRCPMRTSVVAPPEETAH